MKIVTLMCFAIAGLVGAGGVSAPVQARGSSAQPPAHTQSGPAHAAPSSSGPASAPSAGRSASPTGIRNAEKRRRSYASCNRESHNRNLRGGARRRFLIRCRLGYERRRQGQQPGSSAQPQAAPPAKAPAAVSPPPAKAPPVQGQPQPQTQPPAKRP